MKTSYTFGAPTYNVGATPRAGDAAHSLTSDKFLLLAVNS